MATIKRTTINYALILGFVALICTLITLGMYLLTQDRIQQAMENQQRQLLAEVLPKNFADNNLLAACYRPKENSHLQNISRLYLAQKQQNIVAYLFETTAPDGYSGDIRILVAVTPEGKVLGVRVLEHHETPGLGDKIETRLSNWIYAFTNKIFKLEESDKWAVKKDGGDFDQFAGATITPRAVVNAVKKGLVQFLAQPFTFNPEQFTRCQ
ncbi:electron transport complex subunit RsxG [Gallibacterium melopsittaci]|uniref:Ion-translocating oxidoreductase complex subunit G n=1 Tax=Gallibacterium melopsittaci TaxID=516063 RepID=A0ABV6HTW8_9PAST